MEEFGNKMAKILNVYCDESCHLENDNSNIMVIGGVICPNDCRKQIYKDIKDIKKNNGIKPSTEVKWTKVSASKREFYLELVNYFFNTDGLGFRAMFFDKTLLNHEKFNQTFDDFYYKMYYLMLKGIFEANTNYNIYLDMKDTLGYQKIQLLKEICNNLQISKEYSYELVQKIQEVRSNENELIQLSDILIGAVGYTNRELSSNSTKMEIIDLIKKRTGYNLHKTTFVRESKFNLFRWEPQKEVSQWE